MPDVSKVKLLDYLHGRLADNPEREGSDWSACVALIVNDLIAELRAGQFDERIVGTEQQEQKSNQNSAAAATPEPQGGEVEGDKLLKKGV